MRLLVLVAAAVLWIPVAAAVPSTSGNVPTDTGASTDPAFRAASAVTVPLTANASPAYSSTNAATNSSALNAVLATGRCAFIPYNANGYSFAGNTITVSTGQCILGENQVTLYSQPGASGYFIRVTSFEVLFGPAIIENIKIDMTGAGASTTAIRFGTSSGVVAGAQISRILCFSAVECIGDEVHATNYVVDIKISDLRALLTFGRQIYIRRSRGFMWLDTIRIDQTCNPSLCGGATQATVTWSSARFEDFIGLEINRFDSVGPIVTTPQLAVSALEIVGVGTGSASVWLNRILVDNVPTNGIAISGVNFLNANWLESFGNLGSGITMSTIGFSELTNVFVVGGVGIPGAAASANGLSCTACTNVAISNLLTSNNTGSGLVFAGASAGVSISNHVATGNTGFATVLVNTAEGILIDGGSWTSNGGLLSNGSTGGNIVIRNVNGYPWRSAQPDVNYTALASDDEVAYTSISAARTVTLPPASRYPQGRVLTISDASGSASSTITISAAPNGSDTINGSNTTQVMVRNARGSVGLQSNGVNGWTFVVRGVNAGGTGLSAGTSGAVPYFNSSTTMASSGAFTANGVVIGGGAGGAPSSTAAGTNGQVLTGVTGAAPTFQSLRQTLALSGQNGFAAGATAFMVHTGAAAENPVSAAVAMSGTFRNLFVHVSVAPSVTETVTATLRVNGADTGVTCTITGASTSCSDTTHTASITAGQLWSVKLVYSAASAASVPNGAIQFDNP